MHAKIYLDDVRPCPDGWMIARTVDDAKRLITLASSYEISLDHDLGGNGPDATALIPWICAVEKFPTVTYIHTANPVGRKNLEFDISFMRRCEREKYA